MPETDISPLLCSDTAQVPQVDTTPIFFKHLAKKLTVLWFKANHYPDIASRIETCGTSFIHLECSNGHKKYARLHCKQDFCPKCGQNWSGPHKRRAVRAMDRLIWGPVVGYMIYTLPEKVSAQRPDREALNYLSKKAWEITKKNFDTDGGMVRTHLMGEKNEKLQIHFNVLFPNRRMDTIGRVSQETLSAVRQEWADVINGYFELGNEQQNCYYNFVWEYGKRIHKVKYVMRAIVTTEKFMSLSDEDKHYVVGLRGWHNTRWFGKLANSQYKKYLASQGVNYTQHEDKDVGLTKRCPICKEKFKYFGVISANALPRHELRHADKDTLVDLCIHAHLKSKDP